MINKTLYAYIDINNPIVAWEIAIGRICSACDSKDNFGISLWMYGKFLSVAQQRTTYNAPLIKNEFKLELVRQKYFPEKVSRGTGVFLFESVGDAKRAIETWFPKDKTHGERINSITQVNFSANKLTRVDSNWISEFLCKDTGENDEWIHNYWKGNNFNDNPIYEVIASGIGMIMNDELRINAYKKILQIWPTSTPLLSMASCAFAYKKIENIALMKCALISDESKKIKGSAWINIEDLKRNEKEIIHALSIAKEKNELPPMILPNGEDAFFQLPDMRNFAFELNQNELEYYLSKFTKQS